MLPHAAVGFSFLIAINNHNFKIAIWNIFLYTVYICTQVYLFAVVDWLPEKDHKNIPAIYHTWVTLIQLNWLIGPFVYVRGEEGCCSYI